jgi:protein-S-isoprenylcysteine O-methyltransferase Ste14
MTARRKTAERAERDHQHASSEVTLRGVAPLPYNSSSAKIAFDVVIGVFALLEWRIRLRSHLNRHGSRSDRGSLLVVVATVSGGMAGGLVLAGTVPATAIAVARWPIFVLGLMLMIAGIVIRQWAVAVLGQFFTVDIRVHPGQNVVERGPYRWVRHPSYSGMIVTFLGVGLALGNWAALAVLTLVPTAGLIVRIHFEERALLDGLGEPYRRFAAARPHLFPGLW